MGFRLTITVKTEKRLVVLTERPIAHWCEACGAESSFVDEGAEASLATALPEKTHRLIINGRGYLCLRSITAQP
jgi:hypothetical protein